MLKACVCVCVCVCRVSVHASVNAKLRHSHVYGGYSGMCLFNVRESQNGDWSMKIEFNPLERQFSFGVLPRSAGIVFHCFHHPCI